MVVRASRVATGAFALMVVVAMTAASPVRAAEPPLAGASPVFTCTIPHATQSSALGAFATSLTVWTRVTDAPADHVAAILWLEPPIVGAMSGLGMAAAAGAAATVPVGP